MHDLSLCCQILVRISQLFVKTQAASNFLLRKNNVNSINLSPIECCVSMYSSICKDVTHSGQESIDEMCFVDVYAYSEPQSQEFSSMLDWNVITVIIQCETALWTNHTLSIKYCDDANETHLIAGNSSSTVSVNEYEYSVCKQTVNNIMDDLYAIKTTYTNEATPTGGIDVGGDSNGESLMYTISADDNEVLNASDGHLRDKTTNIIDDNATLTIISIHAPDTSDSNDNTLVVQ